MLYVFGVLQPTLWSNHNWLFRNDSCSRNVYRHDDLKDCVELEKIKDHFIFNIESTGAIKPTEMVGSMRGEGKSAILDGVLFSRGSASVSRGSNSSTPSKTADFPSCALVKWRTLFVFFFYSKQSKIPCRYFIVYQQL